MNCDNCGSDISAEFIFAIKNNQCPACGKHIMAPERLASFVNLRELLANNFDNVDAERIASLVVANFELKQRFKEEIVKREKQNPSEEGTIEVSEDDIDADERKAKLAEAREIGSRLKQLREEALGEAQADHWGLGEANAFTDKETMHELVQRQRKEQSFDTVVSGTGGKNSFTRSG